MYYIRADSLGPRVALGVKADNRALRASGGTLRADQSDHRETRAQGTESTNGNEKRQRVEKGGRAR